ncbi:MAG: hypothetical protein FJW40_07040 [Acidobacteria bacterium]|nr:hypothetical protein [Acidobacteriota bacterium]
MTRFLFTLCLAASAAMAANLTDSLKAGKPALKSASVLAFGPEGILFVGDSMGAQVVAIDTGDRKASSAAGVELKGVAAKVAGLLGTAPDQILVNDMAVNPLSRNIYLAVSRGRGPDAAAVIVKVDTKGTLTEVALDNVKHSAVSLPNAAAVDAKDRRGQSLRTEAITDIGWVDGRVLVAGLSNEEFSSNLRAIPFPFQTADNGSSVEIFHGAHGRFETNSPVRTFLPYKIAGEQHLLAAYTCTPLVKFPISALQPGAKVKGVTIAELGNRNRPLDMVSYSKGGKPFILMNNSSRGVMKLPANGLDSYKGITAQTDVTGVPYETVAAWKGVEQIDGFDTKTVSMLVRGEDGSLDLKTVEFP